MGVHYVESIAVKHVCVESIAVKHGCAQQVEEAPYCNRLRKHRTGAARRGFRGCLAQERPTWDAES
jgi:hypothetical protein